jgi:Predicted transcriptional regulator
MRKIDQVYRSLLELRVVNSGEALDAVRRVAGDVNMNYAYNEYLKKLLKQEKLVRVRRGLYIVLNELETREKFTVDKFLLASKLRKRYYLGYHSALEFYGSAYSMYGEVYICIKKEDRFNPFNFRGVSFKPVYVSDMDTEITERKYRNVFLKVSSKERTFVDCLQRVHYAGGWEECLKSLEMLSGLDFEKVCEVLERVGNELTLRKAGYVLELLSKHSIYYEGVDADLLERIRKRIGKTPMYLERGRPSSLDKRWNIYVPEGFEGYLRGI